MRLAWPNDWKVSRDGQKTTVNRPDGINKVDLCISCGRLKSSSFGGSNNRWIGQRKTICRNKTLETPRIKHCADVSPLPHTNCRRTSPLFPHTNCRWTSPLFPTRTAVGRLPSSPTRTAAVVYDGRTWTMDSNQQRNNGGAEIESQRRRTQTVNNLEQIEWAPCGFLEPSTIRRT